MEGLPSVNRGLISCYIYLFIIYLNYYLSSVEGLPLVDRGLISCYFLVVFKLHTSLYDYFFRLLCYVILNSVYYYRSTYLYSLLSPADHPTSLKSMISSPISIQYCFIGQEFHRMAQLHLVTVYAASCQHHTWNSPLT